MIVVVVVVSYYIKLILVVVVASYFIKLLVVVQVDIHFRYFTDKNSTIIENLFFAI